MVRRSLRMGLWMGLLAGVGWGLRRVLVLRRATDKVEVSREPWSPIAQPVAGAEPVVAEVEAPPEAPAGAPAGAEAQAASLRTWAEPRDGACPPTHPVKVKLASGIFHLPGMLAYDRTHPDRCYRTEDDAVADGFVKAKR